ATAVNNGWQWAGFVTLKRGYTAVHHLPYFRIVFQQILNASFYAHVVLLFLKACTTICSRRRSFSRFSVGCRLFSKARSKYLPAFMPGWLRAVANLPPNFMR